ncbi:MAG: hypothetical protein CMI54_03995 [Parcubacteria group bacterium]|nr:hypothetical protein [Parcubacteria group bacterium]
MSEETQVQEPEMQETTPQPESFVDGPGDVQPAEDVINDIMGAQEFGSDAFEELMTDAKENVPGTTLPEIQTQEEVEIASEGPQGTEEDSFQYWQSQADIRARELEEVKTKYQDLEEIAPLARYIRDNPQVLNSVESSLSADKPMDNSPQGNSQELAKKPERPSKPAEYDPIEATSDPDSTSFKYRESLESYRDDMMDYYEGRERNRDVAMQEQQDKIAQQQYMDNVRSQLQNVYGFEDKEMESFIIEMSRPESLSLENLVSVWRLNNKPTEQQVKSPQKVKSMQTQKEKLGVKQPVGVVPSSGQVAKSTEDQLMDAMVADHKSRNPW